MRRRPSDVQVFLHTVDSGRSVLRHREYQKIYSPGSLQALELRRSNSSAGQQVKDNRVRCRDKANRHRRHSAEVRCHMQILAATDFSTRSNRALRQAGLLAQPGNAQLHIVHVVDDDQPEELVRMEKREAERVLTEQIEFDAGASGRSGPSDGGHGRSLRRDPAGGCRQSTQISLSWVPTASSSCSTSSSAPPLSV